MIILVIPIVFALVMGLLCMSFGGWVALALGLEVFGTVTTPKRHRARNDSPANVFAKLLMIGAFVYLVGGMIYVAAGGQ